jgi:CDP-6-deoxy-D-xylo-4-hexulose-3-dehydrase
MIRITGQVYGAEERAALLQCYDEEDGTAGRFPREFECELAAVTGRRFAILCNSGSSANLLAMSALEAGFGDVITCATGFPTTAAPIIQTGHIPVWVDCDSRMNLDAKELNNALSTSTVGVIAANTLGLPLDLEAIGEFCKQHGLWFINDCCDALGGYHNGRPVTAYGDISTLSFYPAHQISTGEGGAVLTDDPQIAKAVRSFRDWGRDCWCAPGYDNTCGKRFAGEYDHKYTYSRIGYNLNMSKYQAALGLAQLGKLTGFVRQRMDNFMLLDYLLRGDMNWYALGHYATLIPAFLDHPSFFGYPIFTKDKQTRDALVQHLEANGVMTRPVFGGNLTRQPAFRGIGRIVGDLHNANRVMDCALWVGVWPGLGMADMEYIAQTVRSYFA